MTALQQAPNHALMDVSDEKEFITMKVDNYLFGISVLAVQDVLRSHTIIPIPLSPPMVAGALNLRGRIVTAIDIRKRMGLPPSESERPPMHVVVNYRDELFSLLVDRIGDVKTLSMHQFEKTPSNLQDDWADMSAGVFKLDDALLVILDIPGIIGI